MMEEEEFAVVRMTEPQKRTEEGHHTWLEYSGGIFYFILFFTMSSQVIYFSCAKQVPMFYFSATKKTAVKEAKQLLLNK